MHAQDVRIVLRGEQAGLADDPVVDHPKQVVILETLRYMVIPHVPHVRNYHIARSFRALAGPADLVRV